MANTYTWDFPTLDTAPTEGDLSDVVKTIHWRVTAVSDSETDDDGNIGIDGNLFVMGELVTNWNGREDNVVIDDDSESVLSVDDNRVTTFTGILLRLNI